MNHNRIASSKLPTWITIIIALWPCTNSHISLEHHLYFDATNHNPKFHRLAMWLGCVLYM